MIFAFSIFLVCGNSYQIDYAIFLEKVSFVNRIVRFYLATWWHHAPVRREKRIIYFFRIYFWARFRIDLFVFFQTLFELSFYAKVLFVFCFFFSFFKVNEKVE